MRPVKILTDSCSDLPRELREKYDIDYVFMNYTLDGKEYPANLDWKSMSATDFYKTMRERKRFFTNQVPVTEFKRAFTEYVEKGMDVIYIGCSSKQSGSVNTGFMVAKEMKEQNKDAGIFVIDSLNACIGEGMLAIRAAEYRDKGLSAEEIATNVEYDRKRVNEFVTVHSLEYLKNAGRVKASAAFFGNLLGVKPILIADKNGEQTPIKKVKGRQTSLAEIAELTKETIKDSEEQTIFIMHADCPEEAAQLEKIVRETIPCKDVCISYIGPIIGASIGPDAIGIWSFGKEVTYAV